MSQINYTPGDWEEHVTAKTPGPAEAGGETLIYLNCLNVRNIFVEVNFTYGADVDTLFDFVEADDVAGTNAQTVTVDMPIWYNTDIDLAHAWEKKSASSHTIDTGDGKNQKILFQIDPMYLSADLTDGAIETKKAVALRIGPSDALNIISVVYHVLTRNQDAVDLRI